MAKCLHFFGLTHSLDTTTSSVESGIGRRDVVRCAIASSIELRRAFMTWTERRVGNPARLCASDASVGFPRHTPPRRGLGPHLSPRRDGPVRERGPCLTLPATIRPESSFIVYDHACRPGLCSACKRGGFEGGEHARPGTVTLAPTATYSKHHGNLIRHCHSRHYVRQASHPLPRQLHMCSAQTSCAS